MEKRNYSNSELFTVANNIRKETGCSRSEAYYKAKDYLENKNTFNAEKALKGAKVMTKSVTAEQMYPIITPQIIRIDMLLTLWEIIRIKLIERIEPRNAARIITAELMETPFARANIITRATTILAPDEIPRTKGPAMGLEKKVCRRKPATDKAPPRITAARIRGRRISHMICPLTEASSWLKRIFPTSGMVS